MRTSVPLLLLYATTASYVDGHGTMTDPPARQPESLYWYQVGCMVGCTCSGGGKETYPSAESVDCLNPIEPTNTDTQGLTWNLHSKSPRQSWNQYMPWRAPGSSIPLDACGIASGFLPTAKVQYPHEFSSSSSIEQGMRGTELPSGPITTWNSNSIVEASFSLIVNHGGGYQYRVCPKASDLTNECFEKNPLGFETDTHIVTTATTGKTIEIPATDISIGVQPTGSTWRRIPLPACNCDLGTGCYTQSTVDEYIPYDNTTMKPHGHCTTGLQFEAPHLETLWPEGYGYYVATLGDDGSSGTKCSIYKNATSCYEIDHCAWYAEKNICYETRTDKYDKDKEENIGEDPCPKQTDESSCQKTSVSNEDSYCTWYADNNKQVCYDKGLYGRLLRQRRHMQQEKDSGKQGGEINWYITDKIRSPSEPGDYVLQWRWDNEQTPQIWTTCADIQVVDADESTSSSRAISFQQWWSVSSLLIISFVATTSFLW